MDAAIAAAKSVGRITPSEISLKKSSKLLPLTALVDVSFSGDSFVMDTYFRIAGGVNAFAEKFRHWWQICIIKKNDDINLAEQTESAIVMKDFYGRDMTVQTLPINLMLINASERGREVRFGADSNFKDGGVCEMREVVAVALH